MKLYIQRYICTHSYIKPRQDRLTCDFHYYLYIYVSSQYAQYFVTTFIKTPQISENMTIWPRDFTKETRWGHIREPATAPREILLSPINMHIVTLILQGPTKHFKTSNVSLFDLLPSGILAYIDICLSVLKHCDKFKHVILCFKYMCNPLLLEIPHKLCTPYHIFGAFRWYNQ